MIKILINEEEVVCSNKITINEEMLSTSSTILNNCYPKEWETTKEYVNNFYYPKDYSSCKIYENDVLIFAGVVKNTGNISLNPRYPKFCDLQILDYKTLLSEGETLDFVISNKTINEAIEMVVNAISDYGVILGNIEILNGDDVIGAYSTLNKSAYDVLQYLAEITNAKWNTRLIDEDKIAIDFYDPSLLPSGVNIDYTKEWFETNEIEDISFSYSANDYRNKQVMISDQVYAGISYDELIIANGFNDTYNTTQNIGKIQGITVNGVEKTFVTDKEKEIGIDADFYYTPGNNTITSDEIYSSGSEILINYVPLVQGREILINGDEVQRIENQIDRKGVIARYETRNDITSSQELDKVGQTYITFKGSSEIILKVKTTKNLWEVGQTLNFNAPMVELSKNYMVKSKKTNIITSIDKIFYEYELSSSFNSERAINYFDNQRAKSKGNIGEGEFITRNIDIYNNANIIFDNLQVEEIQVDGDNTLNSVLNSPFIN